MLTADQTFKPLDKGPKVTLTFTSFELMKNWDLRLQDFI